MVRRVFEKKKKQMLHGKKGAKNMEKSLPLLAFFQATENKHRENGQKWWERKWKGNANQYMGLLIPSESYKSNRIVLHRIVYARVCSIPYYHFSYRLSLLQIAPGECILRRSSVEPTKRRAWKKWQTKQKQRVMEMEIAWRIRMCALIVLSWVFRHVP